MASPLQLSLILLLSLSFCFSQTVSAVEAPLLNFSSLMSPTVAPGPQHYHHHPSMNPTSLYEPVLTNLGFQELSMAVPSLSSDSTYTSWNGPSTLFAPTDSSLLTCGPSCSIPQLLREHMVPGIFSFDYLRKLAFGTKLETMSPGRCITVTSAVNVNRSIIYIGGVEITHPDLFYNGLIMVHRLEGFVSPLSPFSCNIERMPSPTSTTTTTSSGGLSSFSPQPSTVADRYHAPPSPAIMRLMLRDAMLRLHNNGFSILALALRVKYPEVVNLHNVTVFALDDASIFAGGHAYLSNFRFHVVPNRLLMNADLMKLPAGTTLPTMDHSETLMVTTAGGGNQAMRINYVKIKVPDVMYNVKIVVHSVYLPFPHLHPTVVEYGGGIGYEAVAASASSGATNDGLFHAMGSGSCAAGSEKDHGSCAAAPPTARE